jgi:peptidoglycan/xylan/chitin deacetylase (PgdA/CDA1 family)
MYGVLLPAPDIGLRGAAVMRACRNAGHECGIHTWDHVVWQDNVREADAAWTRAQMDKAYQRFGNIFGAAPTTHGAAGWQMNEVALKQLDSWGMAYASDGRGTTPYRLKIEKKPLRHVQLPTTLPTIDELVGTDGIDEDNVARALLTRTDIEVDQVFTLHAELEGGLFASAFEDLLDGWIAQGHQLMTLASAYRALEQTQLPLAPLTWGEIPGRSGELMLA